MKKYAIETPDGLRSYDATDYAISPIGVLTIVRKNEIASAANGGQPVVEVLGSFAPGAWSVIGLIEDPASIAMLNAREAEAGN